jgi:hypothetical protein
MARCPHKNVQQFTETCSDCGRNIYETDEEYLQYLLQQKQANARMALSNRIETLEVELGISHPGNNRPVQDDQISNIGW